ncbi:MAG: hypothetical protein ACOYOK_01255 [Pseudobdellovibrionaceae bacterium]
MSVCLWHHSITPDVSSPVVALEDSTYKDIVENVKKILLSNQEITIPDAKAFRSMSRASLLLSHVAMGIEALLKDFRSEKSFQVGIYCAIENGPLDAVSTEQILQKPESEFAEAYRKFRNPKMYLKQLPNLAPAQMGISLEILGPMNVYTHSKAASIHALQQAEWDLKNGIVQRALVCTAYSFEDFLVVKRTRRQDNRTLAEGAAAVLLGPSEELTDWNDYLTKDQFLDSADYYGIADQLIKITRGL